MADVDLSPQEVARVRDAADLLEVVSDHVHLRRRGRTWEGLCPFHDEKTPSFSVDPDKGLYYCFGCHKGGDLFKFVMEVERVTFPDAVQLLARRYGVRLPPRSPETLRRHRERERVEGLLEEAQRFFAEQLAGPDGAAARGELERRGFDRATWGDFGFGFAPDDWRRLLDDLGRRHPEGPIIEAGLAVRPDSGGRPYDRFRNRLTFPVRGADGALVAFGGRILGDGEPKYLNSPESAVFHKRSTLFCLDRARRAIGDTGQALVVEGYFDCLSLHRVGITHTVATLGTALTSEQARLLRRRLGDGGRVVLCYDADAAGRRAAASGAGVLLEAGIEVAVVALPPGTDPDDVVRDGGAEAMAALLEHPLPLLEFVLSDLPEDPAARRRAGLALAPLVCSAADAALRQNLVEELARLLYLRPREIEEHGRRGRRREAASPARLSPRETSRERHLVWLLVDSPSAWRARILEVVDAELIRDDSVRQLFRRAEEVLAAADPPEDLVRALLDLGLDDEATALLAEISGAGLPAVTEAAVRTQLRALAAFQARQRARRLAPEIAAAERDGDTDRIQQLLAEKARILREKTEL